MHKKHYRHKRESPLKIPSSSRVRVKSKKDSEVSIHELTVPQNSKCDVRRGRDDLEGKGNHKAKHKHKEKRSEKQDHDKHEKNERHHHSKKREKQSGQSNNERTESKENEHTSQRKEKSSRKSKREEKSHIEKLLGELNKNSNKPRVIKHRSRSFSVESSEYLLKRRQKHIRRENTFHAENLRKSNYSDSLIAPGVMEIKRPKTKEKSERKHKHKQKEPTKENIAENNCQDQVMYYHKQKDATKKDLIENFQNQVMYCHVDTQNPFKKEKKKYSVDELYAKRDHKGRSEKVLNKARKSSSNDLYTTLCGDGTHVVKEETSVAEVRDSKRTKERKHSDPIKYSTRKSKLKVYTKSPKDPRSTISLGPYNKYFVFEKGSEMDNTAQYRQEKRYRKTGHGSKNDRKYHDDNEEIKERKSKRKRSTEEKLTEKSKDEPNKQEQLREKIEDDLKGYFTKIQSLIDKKLDYLLHSTGKEGKFISEQPTETPHSNRQRDKHSSQERKEEKSDRHRSLSKRERSEKDRKHESKEKELKSRSHRSRTLEKQKKVKDDSRRNKHNHILISKHTDKSRRPAKLVVTDEEEEEEEQPHKRQKSPKAAVHNSFSSEHALVVTKAPKTEEDRGRQKSKLRSSRSPQAHRDQEKNERNEKGEYVSDFRVEGVEPAKLLECNPRRHRRREARPFNLECKTVSIIGIPSQIRASTVYSQAQTSPSASVANAAMDAVERRKQSKRFKLYYKYSVADNKCSRSDSGHSTDGKSVISDSYRVMSNNSVDDRESVNSDNIADVKEEEPTKDSGKIFVMKKDQDTRTRHCDVFNEVLEHKARKYRKQLLITPKPSKLNNILEESSNVSIHSRTSRCPDELNCKYFKLLNTSSSDCNLQVVRKSTLSDWNMHPGRFGLPSRKFNMAKIAVIKSRHKKESPERDSKPEKKVKLSEKRLENKPKTDVAKSTHRIQRAPRDFGGKFASKSDIDISYDSLHAGRNYRTKANKDLLPDVKPEKLQSNREKCSYKNTIHHRSPTRAKSNSSKVDHKPSKVSMGPNTDNNESQTVNENDNNLDAPSDVEKHHLRKKSAHNQVSRIPSKKYVERQTSGIQFPDTGSSQNVTRVPEKVVRNSSCQFKELIDVGVEANLIEGLNNIELFPKPFPKTAEVAVEAKVIRKQFPIYRNERPKHPQTSLQKTSNVGVEASVPHPEPPPGQCGNLVKNSSPPRKEPLRRIVSPRIRRFAPYSRQKSEFDRIKDQNTDKQSLTKEKTIGPKKPDKASPSYERNNNEKTEKCSSNNITCNKSLEVLKSCSQHKQTRSVSCSEKNRKDVANLRSSKSAVNVGETATVQGENEKNSSAHLSEITCPVKTNSLSLEQNAVKSIINDNPHTSRLFLTKDFSREMNSYQRRKLYDEGMRQKMRQKTPCKPPPQVFEVRFLTVEEDPETKTDTTVANRTDAVARSIACRSNKSRTKPPTFSCNSKSSKNSFRKRVTPKKSLRSIIKMQSTKDVLVSSVSGRNPFRSTLYDVDKLAKSRKIQNTEKGIEEIFMSKTADFKEHSISNMFSCCKQLADIQSSSLLLKGSSTSVDNTPCFGNDNFSPNNDSENFMQIIDCLCKSIVSYCNSKLFLLDDETQRAKIPANVENKENKESDDESSNVEEIPAKTPLAGTNQCIRSYKETNQLTNIPPTIKNKPPKGVMSCRSSCPALANTPPSFEFLYEEESDISKETIAANITKPLDTILGYALNDTTPVFHSVKLTHFRKNIDQLSNSPTESGESGYSSNSSKRFSSITNFFKKPTIAALLKPRIQAEISSRSKISLTGATPSMTDYSLMTQQCHEYAQKVRIHSESKAATAEVEAFQEIPLNVLLAKSKSESFNSNCSLCRELSKSKHDVNGVALGNSSSVASMDIEPNLVQSENEMETLIYFGNQHQSHEPCLEIVKSKKLHLKDSCVDIRQSPTQSRPVLSSTNLNRCSLTLIDTKPKSESGIKEDVANYEKLTELSQKKYNEIRSVQKTKSNLSNIVSSTLITNSDEGKSKDSLIASKTDVPVDKKISDHDLPTNVHDSADVKKLLAKKFFENLLDVYEKELAVTTRLFQDDLFLNRLVDYVKTYDDSSKHAVWIKGKQKTKIITGKLMGCLGKAFTPKVESSGSNIEEDPDEVLENRFEKTHQENLKVLAYNARRYFSLLTQAVSVNKGINDEMKMFGLLKLLERIEDGDFSILRKEEDVNFEDEIKEQVLEGFLNIYKVSVKEAKKSRRALTEQDLKLIRAFICKYRIGLLSKTDVIANYIGRGLFKTESQLRAAVTYLIRSKNKDIDLKDFEEYCNVCTNCKR